MRDLYQPSTMKALLDQLVNNSTSCMDQLQTTNRWPGAPGPDSRTWETTSLNCPLLGFHHPCVYIVRTSMYTDCEHMRRCTDGHHGS